MKSVPLTAFPRTLSRRGGAKKLRASGRIPAVVYGGQNKPENLEVDCKSLEDLIHHSASENLLVDLAIDKDSRPKRLALVKEVQHYALTGEVLHVDFHEISPTEKVTVMVPVESIGEATGVKNGGGVLEHVLHKVKVRCLPKDLPEVITVDVTALEIGRAIHIGEIKLPEGVEILGDKHISVLAVKAPVTEAEETAAAEASAATTEVEMIKEKKEDGEAAPAGKAPAAAAKTDEKKPAEKKK
jgi:large subunit ribosomal protein L25